MRVGYFDCFGGASGDMTLGALVDAGADGRAIIAAVESLGLPGELSFETVRRGGFRATHARVKAEEERAHRHWRHVEAIIDKGELTASARELAKRIFLKLGEAEARVHGIDLARIHFHEVGAVDSIIDIVGSAVGLDALGVDRFECSAIPPGRGFIRAEHGRMPLPAPATAEILKGVPLAESPLEMEMTTPTGAAIMTTIAARFGSLPAMTVESIGLGAGTREVPGQANVLRLFVGELASTRAAGEDRVFMVETNLDDIPGELIGHATVKLLEAGALDVFTTPIQMKKNRPGVMIGILCDEGRVAAMEDILFRETTTLGVRRYPVGRRTLHRKAVDVETNFGPVRGKLGWLEGRPPTFSPEYDDCARIAAERGVPLREVYDAARVAHARAAAESADHPKQPPHDR